MDSLRFVETTASELYKHGYRAYTNSIDNMIQYVVENFKYAEDQESDGFTFFQWLDYWFGLAGAASGLKFNAVFQTACDACVQDTTNYINSLENMLTTIQGRLSEVKLAIETLETSSDRAEIQQFVDHYAPQYDVIENDPGVFTLRLRNSFLPYVGNDPDQTKYLGVSTDRATIAKVNEANIELYRSNIFDAINNIKTRIMKQTDALDVGGGEYTQSVAHPIFRDTDKLTEDASGRSSQTDVAAAGAPMAGLDYSAEYLESDYQQQLSLIPEEERRDISNYEKAINILNDAIEIINGAVSIDDPATLSESVNGLQGLFSGKGYGVNPNVMANAKGILGSINLEDVENIKTSFTQLLPLLEEEQSILKKNYDVYFYKNKSQSAQKSKEHAKENISQLIVFLDALSTSITNIEFPDPDSVDYFDKLQIILKDMQVLFDNAAQYIPQFKSVKKDHENDIDLSKLKLEMGLNQDGIVVFGHEGMPTELLAADISVEDIKTRLLQRLDNYEKSNQGENSTLLMARDEMLSKITSFRDNLQKSYTALITNVDAQFNAIKYKIDAGIKDKDLEYTNSGEPTAEEKNTDVFESLDLNKFDEYIKKRDSIVDGVEKTREIINEVITNNQFKMDNTFEFPEAFKKQYESVGVVNKNWKSITRIVKTLKYLNNIKKSMPQDLVGTFDSAIQAIQSVGESGDISAVDTLIEALQGIEDDKYKNLVRLLQEIKTFIEHVTNSYEKSSVMADNAEAMKMILSQKQRGYWGNTFEVSKVVEDALNIPDFKKVFDEKDLSRYVKGVKYQKENLNRTLTHYSQQSDLLDAIKDFGKNISTSFEELKTLGEALKEKYFKEDNNTTVENLINAIVFPEKYSVTTSVNVDHAGTDPEKVEESTESTKDVVYNKEMAKYIAEEPDTTPKGTDKLKNIYTKINKLISVASSCYNSLKRAMKEQTAQETKGLTQAPQSYTLYPERHEGVIGYSNLQDMFVTYDPEKLEDTLDTLISDKLNSIPETGSKQLEQEMNEIKRLKFIIQYLGITAKKRNGEPFLSDDERKQITNIANSFNTTTSYLKKFVKASDIESGQHSWVAPFPPIGILEHMKTEDTENEKDEDIFKDVFTIYETINDYSAYINRALAKPIPQEQQDPNFIAEKIEELREAFYQFVGKEGEVLQNNVIAFATVTQWMVDNYINKLYKATQISPRESR